MDAPELQRYMRALLTALRHVHSFGVIHRDVKPSNFLYERETNKYDSLAKSYMKVIFIYFIIWLNQNYGVEPWVSSISISKALSYNTCLDN